MVATAKATRAVAAVATPRTTRSLSAIHKGGRREPPPADPSHDAAGSSNAAAAVDEGSLAARHLISADPRFEAVVNAHGTLCLRRGGPESGSAFAALVKTICFQQLAGKAATTIHGRAIQAIGSDPPTPKAVLATPHATLRAAGLSDRKASYITDLATHFSEGRLSEEVLRTATDDELVEKLTAVRGIGVWTCHIFMMFRLGRPDVLPVGDLGVQKGFAKFFGLGTRLPKPPEMEQLAQSWSPFRSYASAYMWRVIDVKTPGS